MSQTRTETSEAGYTLLELLVVLAIISMIVTAAPVIYQHLVPSYQTRQFANDLADHLRTLRETARQDGTVTQLSFDGEDGSLIIGSVHFSPPSGATATYEPDATAATGTPQDLQFFPSGASTGGTVAVKRKDLTINIDIDWISGAIEVKQ